MPDTIRKFQYQGAEKLLLPATPEAFETLRQWLVAIAGDLHFSGLNRNRMLIAADEIFSNIAKYGYPSEPGKASVEVNFNMKTKTLNIIFSDAGVAFNPLLIPEPDTDAPLEKRTSGGLGIFMVKKLMDKVEYRRENNFNILTISKKMDVD